VAARIIADACSAPAPSLRYPSEAQAPIDQMRALNDKDYQRLCAGDGVEEILTQYQADDTPWGIC
jgi:hypothetical protein